MAINVFEGARRISKTIMLLILVGTLIAIWYDSPDAVKLTYEIALPGATPTRVEQCSANSTTELISRKSADRDKVSIELCFRPLPAEKTGEMLIPFKLDDDGKSWWLGKEYSSPVRDYASSVASDFTLPAEATKGAGFLLMKQRFFAASKAIGYLSVGLFAFMLLTAFIGWIVRGFFGIPNGMDARPESR
jgi:hypothetical protein